MTNQSAEQIAEIINQAERGIAAKIWEKNGKSRVYLTLTSVRGKQVGYIDLTNGSVDLRNCGIDMPRDLLRSAGVEFAN